MSYRRLSAEQPPTDDLPLREWLTRQFTMINAALDQIPDFTPTGQYPDKLENGMVRYFSNSIPATAITSAGPWMYVQGVWRKMTI